MSSKEQNTPNEQVSDEIQQEQQQLRWIRVMSVSPSWKRN